MTREGIRDISAYIQAIAPPAAGPPASTDKTRAHAVSV
jgi:hypothetical protein